MTDQKLDIDTLYSESCEAIRHYSNSTRAIRTLAIAQGGIIVYAIAQLMKDERILEALCASLFGIVTTWILYKFNTNYFQHTRAVIEFTLELEKKYWAESGAIWQSMERSRVRRWADPLTRFALNHAIFWAFFAVLVTFLVWNTINYV